MFLLIIGFELTSLSETLVSGRLLALFVAYCQHGKGCSQLFFMAFRMVGQVRKFRESNKCNTDFFIVKPDSCMASSSPGSDLWLS